MSENAPLALTGLSKRFGRRVVLDDVSVSIDAGEIFGLVGLNGAGKTTLLKTVLGLARPAGGEALVFGRPGEEAAARQAVSYLPERFTPSPRASGREFLAMSLAQYGLRFDESRAGALAARLAFPPRDLGASIASYSKGMAQKVGLMAALLPERPLLLLDEPMSGLDPEGRAALKGLLAEQAAAGCAVLFSSHVLADIDEIGDRIGVLHQGRLIFAGTLAAFRQSHAGATLEAAFLGAIAETTDP